MTWDDNIGHRHSAREPRSFSRSRALSCGFGGGEVAVLIRARELEEGEQFGLL
jgi:hypothetical protein